MNSSQTDPDSTEFLYSVLNLPPSASQNEIRDRYRTLSVIFHPDKQQDEQTRETANKRFLEIQKAYEVLSDPFLREVYDNLGEEGAKSKWLPDVRSLPVEELRRRLKRAKGDLHVQHLRSLVNPQGKISCGINATSLFSTEAKYTGLEQWRKRFSERISNISVFMFSLRHAVERPVDEKTSVGLSARITRGASTKSFGGNILGTVRHQYSPRLAFEGSVALLQAQTFQLKSTWEERDTTIAVDTQLPLIPRHLPPTTLTLSRRLFRDALMHGVIAIHAGPQPHLTINLISPAPFDLTKDAWVPSLSQDLPGDLLSGFERGTRYAQYGVHVDGLASVLKAEWGLTFQQLKVQLKTALQFGLTGFSGVLTGTWMPAESTEVSTNVALNASGVMLTFEFLYLSQRLSIPVVLSFQYSPLIALCAAVVPSTIFVTGYYFVIRPRRRAKRAAYLRKARRLLDEEKTNLPREAEETAGLLRETAKRHTLVESKKDGLVIQEAKYGPAGLDDEAGSLMVDVTVPLQALVHNSQLYIPGYRSKVGLQGFYDPAPDAPKSLRVRYTFRGRAHYAEIPDRTPVVLPLADHLVMGA